MLQPQRLDCYGLEWTGVALGWTCIGQWMDQLRIQDLNEVWPLKPQSEVWLPQPQSLNLLRVRF